MQNLQQQRMVNADQKAVERITGFRRDLAADPEAHQDRDHHDRQQRRARHRPGFGKGEGAKQLPLLPFEGKNRDKRQGDNQQADKQRRADLHRGIGDNFPARVVGHFLPRVVVLPLFQPLMGVFDHHDGGVNHRPYGNGDTAQRHDIGVQPLKMHDDKGDTEPKRQRDNRHQSGADVPQEQRADQRHDDKLLQQLIAEVVDRPVDQLAAIVGRHDFHPFRQTAFQGLELVFNGGNHFAGVFAGSQDHHAAGHFALAVQFGDTAAHFRTCLHPRHIA